MAALTAVGSVSRVAADWNMCLEKPFGISVWNQKGYLSPHPESTAKRRRMNFNCAWKLGGLREVSVWEGKKKPSLWSAQGT